jgi:hypothetical protein
MSSASPCGSWRYPALNNGINQLSKTVPAFSPNLSSLSTLTAGQKATSARTAKQEDAESVLDSLNHRGENS